MYAVLSEMYQRRLPHEANQFFPGEQDKIVALFIRGTIPNNI